MYAKPNLREGVHTRLSRDVTCTHTKKFAGSFAREYETNAALSRSRRHMRLRHNLPREIKGRSRSVDHNHLWRSLVPRQTPTHKPGMSLHVATESQCIGNGSRVALGYKPLQIRLNDALPFRSVRTYIVMLSTNLEPIHISYAFDSRFSGHS